MHVVIDIETIPDQSEGAIDRFAEDIKVKCPYTTKDPIGKDLGMSPDEIKFTGKGDLEARWIEKFGKIQALKLAEDQWLKTSFDGGYGQIICIGIEINGSRKDFTGTDECSLLSSFWEVMSVELNNRPPFFIAHNAKFDLPFLYHRSVIHEIKIARGFKPHGRHDQDFYCTMQGWAGFGGKISLDKLAKILGIKGKEGMSGADVWPEYMKGNIKKISDYCLDDVRITSEIFNRLTFRGVERDGQ